MNLSSIVRDPTTSLIEMERYVNDGSPSGFTFVYTTSERTRPRSQSPHFRLGAVSPKAGVLVDNLGDVPAELFGQHCEPTTTMLAHPDMLSQLQLLGFAGRLPRLSDLFVQPTASARTVRLCNSQVHGYVKLHYEGHLGRILRRITLKHAQAAIETDSRLADLVAEGKMPSTFAFFREVGARVFRLTDCDGASQWGMVWRPERIHGVSARRISYLVPAFSLFSRDCREPTHATLLSELGKIHRDKLRFILDELLLPLIRSYFAMLTFGGLQGEWHAQNVVFGFDESWHCVATVLRDMESIDRDLPIMAATGRPVSFASYPYKCLEAGDYNYTIRHSFMFDHKFGEYLLGPLIDHACELWDLDSRDVNRVVSESVKVHLRALPENFFPDNGCWYKFANQLIDQSTKRRPYVQLDAPRFRPSSLRR